MLRFGSVRRPSDVSLPSSQLSALSHWLLNYVEEACSEQSSLDVLLPSPSPSPSSTSVTTTQTSSSSATPSFVFSSPSSFVGERNLVKSAVDSLLPLSFNSSALWSGWCQCWLLQFEETPDIVSVSALVQSLRQERLALLNLSWLLCTTDNRSFCDQFLSMDTLTKLLQQLERLTALHARRSFGGVALLSLSEEIHLLWRLALFLCNRLQLPSPPNTESSISLVESLSRILSTQMASSGTSVQSIHEDHAHWTVLCILALLQVHQLARQPVDTTLSLCRLGIDFIVQLERCFQSLPAHPITGLLFLFIASFFAQILDLGPMATSDGASLLDYIQSPWSHPIHSDLHRFYAQKAFELSTFSRWCTARFLSSDLEMDNVDTLPNQLLSDTLLFFLLSFDLSALADPDSVVNLLGQSLQTSGPFDPHLIPPLIEIFETTLTFFPRLYRGPVSLGVALLSQEPTRRDALTKFCNLSGLDQDANDVDPAAVVYIAENTIQSSKAVAGIGYGLICQLVPVQTDGTYSTLPSGMLGLDIVL